jgi:hypothetical protein
MIFNFCIFLKQRHILQSLYRFHPIIFHYFFKLVIAHSFCHLFSKLRHLTPVLSIILINFNSSFTVFGLKSSSLITSSKRYFPNIHSFIFRGIAYNRMEQRVRDLVGTILIWSGKLVISRFYLVYVFQQNVILVVS